MARAGAQAPGQGVPGALDADGDAGVRQVALRLADGELAVVEDRRCQRGVRTGAQGVRRGAGEILLTSMDRDGTEHGYDLGLTSAVSGAVDVPVIASGGAGNLEHLAEALRAGADAALCASIFHYGQHTVAEAKAHLAAAGIAVRA